MLVRRLEEKDVAAVVELIGQLGYQRSEDQVKEWIAKVDAETQAAFVAEMAGAVVGWVEVGLVHHLQSAAYGLIGGLVVKEGMRGRGVGRELREQAEAWSWAKGVGAVRVTSRSTRLDAHRFYARDGYRLEKTSLVFEKTREGAD